MDLGQQGRPDLAPPDQQQRPKTRPRAAELGALLGEQTGHLVNTLEVSARRFSGEMAASASAS
ncbi:MAG TPA: hypothetical protein VNW94_10660 [Streptosporangiaceae bacterium]|nr:hypothetical protein [Streptosporangiaceae bacterium]